MATTILLLLALDTLLVAIPQGIITWLFREYVPPTRQDWVNAALHIFGPLSYALFAVVLVRAYAHFDWPEVARITVRALVVRWVLFDLVLNLTRNWFNHREHRPSEPVLGVGTSANTDRLTRSVAQRLGVAPEWVRVAFYALGLVATWFAAVL